LITAETIREKINETQQLSLGLFQKVNAAPLVAPHKGHVLALFSQVYEKRNVENNASQSSQSPEGDKEKKDQIAVFVP
jgi:molecular chaperone DnaK